MTTRKLGQLRVMEQSANDPSHIRCPYELVQYAENIPPFVRLSTYNEISKQVIRRKLARQRHCVIEKAIDSEYLDSLFPELLHLFEPQEVNYNGGVAGIKRWKISCYLEVMPGGVPTTNPNLSLLQLFTPVLDACNHMFQHWYRQQHACNKPSISKGIECQRVMTFITRYTPQPGEQSLLKHVDGAGKVDGSVVVALPVDRWSAPESVNSFEGGGLTFWDGKSIDTVSGETKVLETHYDTRSGDVAFIDRPTEPHVDANFFPPFGRAVWHQADPITKGTRWALVIFYTVISK